MNKYEYYLQKTSEMESVLQMINIDNYKPCFCGSNKKYKFCCREKSKMPAKKYTELSAKMTQVYKPKQECCYSDIGTCEGNLINAHTIQKKQSLQSITDDSNHVYSLNHKNNYESGFGDFDSWKPQSVSWNKATTFPGMCEKHDRELFNSIDSSEFIGTKDQIYAAGLRSVLYTQYMMHRAVELLEINKEMLLYGKDLEKQIELVAFYDNHLRVRRLGIKDISKLKTRFIENEPDNLNYVNIYLKCKPQIYTAGIANPCFSIYGKEIQDMDNLYFNESSYVEFEGYTISSLKTDDGVCYSYAWPKEYKSMNTFFKDVIALENKKFQAFLTQFIFVNSENVVFSIEWWDNLSLKQQNSIKKLLMVMPDGKFNYIDSIDGFTNMLKAKVKSIESKIES